LHGSCFGVGSKKGSKWSPRNPLHGFYFGVGHEKDLKGAHKTMDFCFGVGHEQRIEREHNKLMDFSLELIMINKMTGVPAY
jgi:hypothetical protein